MSRVKPSRFESDPLGWHLKVNFKIMENYFQVTPCESLSNLNPKFFSRDTPWNKRDPTLKITFRWYPSPAMRLRQRPRLRFSDIKKKILDFNISSCGSNGAVVAVARNLSRRAGSGDSLWKSDTVTRKVTPYLENDFQVTPKRSQTWKLKIFSRDTISKRVITLLEKLHPIKKSAFYIENYF